MLQTPCTPDSNVEGKTDTRVRVWSFIFQTLALPLPRHFLTLTSGGQGGSHSVYLPPVVYFSDTRCMIKQVTIHKRCIVKQGTHQKQVMEHAQSFCKELWTTSNMYNNPQALYCKTRYTSETSNGICTEFCKEFWTTSNMYNKWKKKSTRNNDWFCHTFPSVQGLSVTIYKRCIVKPGTHQKQVMEHAQSFARGYGQHRTCTTSGRKNLPAITIDFSTFYLRCRDWVVSHMLSRFLQAFVCWCSQLLTCPSKRLSWLHGCYAAVYKLSSWVLTART